MIKSLLLVGLGGGLGSILRYSISLFIQRYYNDHFPVATLIANFLGCLLIGVLIAILGRSVTMQTEIKLLLITGFCGGFTTFSAFASENIQLFQSGQINTAMVYILLSIVLCLLAVWCGMLVALFL
jgi:CrcB protein